jgi:hypothetical protein
LIFKPIYGIIILSPSTQGITQMRNIILVCAAASLLLAFAYQAGRANGQAACEKASMLRTAATQTKTETIRKKVNDQANTSATGDIRKRLRERYTIAD